MNVRVCFGCPLRLVEEPSKLTGRITRRRCAILQAKLTGVKGLGLSSIDFNCPTKLALFTPGHWIGCQVLARGVEQ